MKVLHVSPSYYPAFEFGGTIQCVHLLNQTLVNQNIEVDVFTTNAGLAHQKNKYNSSNWSVFNNVRVKYFSFYGYVHYNFSPQILIALLNNIQKYDLIHITAIWNFPVWAAAFVCKLYNKPYIISPHGTIYPETVALKSSFIKKLYYNLLAKPCLTNAAAIHFTTTDEQISVSNFLNLKTRSFVVANGIDLSEFINPNFSGLPPFYSYFNQLNDHPYILFLGRISYKKGLNMLIDAFSEVIKTYPQLKLVIAGPDNENYKEQLLKQSEGLQISHAIVYTGQIIDHQKITAYRDAEMFVLSSYSENFGMSVVEAMACNCPVIISDKVGICTEIADADAGIVVSTNTASIKNGIIALLENKNKAETIKTNAISLIKQKYSITSVTNEMINYYKSILELRQGL
jgi:glycosyltransferase involved in cell wall biosynthesis